jgi:xanthine dehydrogenase iron-sulfur cluster and FAD-binding subunit A
MMYAPRLSLSCPIAQAIEHLSNHLSCTDFGQLFDQFDGFIVRNTAMMTGAIARHA